MAGTEPHAWGLAEWTISHMSDWMCTRRRSAWHWPREKRSGEVRQVGVFQNRPEIVCKMAAKLGRGGRRLSSCYDASPCGYGLHRLLTACGHSCVVVAPSLISMKSGDRSRPIAARR